MVAERGDGCRIRFYEAQDERDEAQFAVRQILEAQRRGTRAFSHCAIFYRTNAQSRPFEEELLRYAVPYVVVGGVRFYERAEVKDALAYLRLLVNPADAQALRRIVNVPPRGSAGEPRSRRRARGGARDLTRGGPARRRRRGRARALRPKALEFVALRTRCEEVAGYRPRPPSLASSRAAATWRGSSARAPPRASRAREPARARRGRGGLRGRERRPAASARRSSSSSTRWRWSPRGRPESAPTGVSMMTVHTAKGLEFPEVSGGLEEGSSRTRRRPGRGGPRGERRLCYVGMTRAMERLRRSAARCSAGASAPQLWGHVALPARGPKDLLGRRRRPSRALQPAAAPSIALLEAEGDDLPTCAPGAVRHPIFGPAHPRGGGGRGTEAPDPLRPGGREDRAPALREP